MQLSSRSEEVDETVMKARYLARIEQLQQRGIDPRRKLTAKDPIEEFELLVHKMEIEEARLKRINTGRTWLRTGCVGIEKGCNIVDRNEWLPVSLGMGGFEEHVRHEMREGTFDAVISQDANAIALAQQTHNPLHRR